MIARSVTVVGVLIAACSSKPAEVADAYVSRDAACDEDRTFTPVSVTGSSPDGSLDIFHYASAGYYGGFCQESYVVILDPRQATITCYGDPELMFAIYPPFDGAGSHMAFAEYESPHEVSSNQVTFEATALDPPSATPPHIAGHLVSHDPDWSFDIAIDLTSQSSTGCI